MGRPLMICTEFSAAELRGLSRLEPGRQAALRMLAIANALDGHSRAEAARLADMSRQALCDAVNRYNAHGVPGLHDLPRSGRPRHLDAEQEQQLHARVVAGPDVEAEGISAYTREDLCTIVREEMGVSFHVSSMSRVLKRLKLSRQKTRPSHPKKVAASEEAFKKRSGTPDQNCRYT